MFSYKFFIRANKNNSLRLRITYNRNNAEISLGVQMTQEILDDALLPKPRPENLKWRTLLQMYQAKLDEIKCDLLKEHNRDVGMSTLKDRILSECFNKSKKDEKNEEKSKEETVAVSFVSHFQTFVNNKSNDGTKGLYKHTLDRIKLFDKNIAKKTFDDIDLKWLIDFEAFCAKTATKNARNIHLRNIRAVFNNAIDHEITTAYPFRRFKIRPEPTRKRSLTVDELRKIFNYPVEEYAEIYRDLFKLIFMLIGINTVDLFRLQNITRDGRVEYRRAKTGRWYSIKVEQEAMEIIQKYKGSHGLLCIADRWSDHRNFRHQMNKALQSIGAEKNKGGRLPGGRPKKTNKNKKPQGIWPELTTYWARHTWATIARKVGVSVDDIALALGHSDDKHETTFIYIDDDEIREKVDEANRKVLDWVLYGKREGQTSE